MRRFLLRRLLLAVPTLLGMTLVTFMLSRSAPGGPLAAQLEELYAQGIVVSEADIAAQERLLGLDKPLVQQYGIWLKRFVTLDFGRSLAPDRRPVRDKLWEAFRVSFLLQLISIAVIYALAVPIGAWSAVRHETRRERLVTLGLFLLYSVPNFLLAYLLIVVFCTGQVFDILPLFGLRDLDAESAGWWASLKDLAHHLVLPVICLTYAGFASISRYARAGMLEVIRQDYIRTARAKGVPERWVVARHALRNSILPIVTLLAMLFPYLVGGSVIVETIFSIPGMGRLVFQSISVRDYPTIMAVSVFVGVATLVGFLITDILYALLDPRVSFE